jgi:DNA-binding beta-propeller fold protein YncE
VTSISAEFATRTGRAPRAVPREVRSQMGRLIVVRPGIGKALGTDVHRIEFATDPDREGSVSNPYAVAVQGDAIYVSDSAGNDLLEVRGPDVRVVATFPHASRGDQSVPDALAAGPDGALYVGEFTGGMQKPRTARIWRVVPGQAPTVFARGLTSVTGLAFGPDGSLYASEFWPSDVVRIAPDGTRSRLGLGSLEFPGGIAVDADGAVFVADHTVFGARPSRRDELGRTGRIVRLT